jgi:hypothetical protein
MFRAKDAEDGVPCQQQHQPRGSADRDAGHVNILVGLGRKVPYLFSLFAADFRSDQGIC